jgi:hypothetical protein
MRNPDPAFYLNADPDPGSHPMRVGSNFFAVTKVGF